MERPTIELLTVNYLNERRSARLTNVPVQDQRFGLVTRHVHSDVDMLLDILEHNRRRGDTSASCTTPDREPRHRVYTLMPDRSHVAGVHEDSQIMFVIVGVPALKSDERGRRPQDTIFERGTLEIIRTIFTSSRSLRTKRMRSQASPSS
jgi:hypothetical protein